MKVPNKKIRAQ